MMKQYIEIDAKRISELTEHLKSINRSIAKLKQVLTHTRLTTDGRDKLTTLCEAMETDAVNLERTIKLIRSQAVSRPKIPLIDLAC